MPHLQELHLPDDVLGAAADGVHPMQPDAPEPTKSSLSFGPLTSLRKLTWKASTPQGRTRVDLRTNLNLRHLALDLGDRYGLGLNGWEVDAYPNRNTLLLPRAPLHLLHLQGVIGSAHTAHPWRDAPWQDSLVDLRLALHSACPDVAIDLSAHTALRRLALECYGQDLAGLRLPPPGALEALSLTGDATSTLLQQLCAPAAKALRRLTLDCRVAPTGAGSIPWESLPNLTELICFSWDDDPDRMQLSRLNIPATNKLQRLRLHHTVFKAHHWAPEHAALQKLVMPHLHTLDLSGINSSWRGEEPVGAIVQSWDEALSRRPCWAALIQLVAAGTAPRSPLDLSLERLAARHGLQFTLAPPDL
jgi:hypothetical protein